MKQRDPYAVSDALLRMRIELLKYEVEGVFWSGKEVRDLNEHLGVLTTYARDLGHEMTRLRWQTRNIPAVTVITGENVIAFPHIPQNKKDINNHGQ